MNPKIIRAKKQREAEPGDDCAAVRSRRIGSQAEREMLRDGGGAEGENYLRAAEAEIAQPGSCGEEDAEEKDLENPRIA